MENFLAKLVLVALIITIVSLNIRFWINLHRSCKQWGEKSLFWFLKPDEPWCYIRAEPLNGESEQSHQARYHPDIPCRP